MNIKITIGAIIFTVIISNFSGYAKINNNEGQSATEKIVTTEKVQKPSSDEITAAVSEKSENNETDYMITTLKYPVISGLKDKSVENKINQRFESEALNFRKSIEDMAKTDYEDSKSDSNIHFNKYEVNTEYSVKYNKNGIMSITVLYYQYTGGAHGSTNQVSYNIDLKTGDLLPLSHMFEKDFDYKQVIINGILNEMQKHKEYYFEDAEKTVKALDDNIPYYIEDDNIVVYYGQYEIAPYAVGILEFKVPFSKLKLSPTLGLNSVKISN